MPRGKSAHLSCRFLPFVVAADTRARSLRKGPMGGGSSWRLLETCLGDERRERDCRRGKIGAYHVTISENGAGLNVQVYRAIVDVEKKMA